MSSNVLEEEFEVIFHSTIHKKQLIYHQVLESIYPDELTSKKLKSSQQTIHR